ncbi:DUF1963 domain-containing protein [Embleya sp. NPDC050154]|uniref:DUF1963 domain-containing protein n=1 Tax=unclassified Embleya TaxID=2699296 RepID=UPI003798DC9B
MTLDDRVPGRRATDDDTLRRGVEIIGGPFKGTTATLDSVEDGHVWAQVDLFGQWTRMSLRRCHVVLPRELHRFGMHTTRARPVDPAGRLPELLPMARTATRLHPCPGVPSPSDSSVGGPLFWPAVEPWPTCSIPHHGRVDVVSEPRGPVPLVPIVQLYARDVSELPYPPGTDLLQVLWCPFDHPDEDGGCWPRPVLYWRNEARVGARPVAGTPEPYEDVPFGTVPRPCLIDPERVVEYPSPDEPEYPFERHSRMEAAEAATGWSYSRHLSVAPGVKVGGWPGWAQPPLWPECACGRRMEHLLTVSSREYDVESGKRWAPIEHVGVDIDPRVDSIGGGFSPTDLCIGDMGGMYLFVCSSCPSMPWAYRFDCS